MNKNVPNFLTGFYKTGRLPNVRKAGASLLFVFCLNALPADAQCLSTAPTAITGPGAVCYATGGSMITASGGVEGSAAVYQWGTGPVAGVSVMPNVTQTIYVNPSATTTYWVRRYDPAPCNGYTAAAFMTINVNTVSTSPVSISGTASTCHNGSTVLTAEGGTAGSGSMYQWGSGAIGSNIITGETGQSITVNPSGGTNYWVRRIDPAPCNRTTGAATISVAVPSTAPTSIAGPASLCYTTGGAFLVASGGVSGTNSVYEWGSGPVIGEQIITTSAINSLYINPSVPTDYWVRRRDPAPCNTYTDGVFFHVDASTVSTSPTAISGNTRICNGASTTLTASGGVHGSAAYYQWGTGYVVGDNIISGENNASITVSPSSNIIYWVRRIDPAPCSRQTYGPTVLVTVPAPVTYSGSGWSAPPDEATPAIVSANLDLTSNVKVCSCLVNNAATFKIHPGSTLSVVRDVVVEPSAQLIVENAGSLVQIDDNGSFTGTMTLKRNSEPMKTFDYTYWSSPVVGWTLNQLSPQTLWDKYFSFNPMVNNWALIVSGLQAMQPAMGYIVRAPQGWSLTNPTAGIYAARFIGKANTGTIPVTIQKGTTAMNLIGNPYPSAIDIESFLTDPANAGIVNGTIYLWTHNTAISNLIPGNAIYNYTADDYAKYNLTGGVRSAATAITGGQLPDGNIASGQAFFIEANDGAPTGTSTAYFKNSMRVENNNNHFFRNGLAANSTDKSRIWLTLSNSNGAFCETLVGYVPGATNGRDAMFDGRAIQTANPVAVYSVLANENYAIQGRALPFNSTDVIAVGYRSSVAGQFTLNLDKMDGLFLEQQVYLIDKLLGLTHNLSASPYLFSTAAGTFNNRFEVGFSADIGKADDVQDKRVILTAMDGTLSILAQRSMCALQVYDMAGKELYVAENIRDTEYDINASRFPNGILLLKISFADGETVTRKFSR